MTAMRPRFFTAALAFSFALSALAAGVKPAAGPAQKIFLTRRAAAFPAAVKQRGDKLWGSASPAVRSFVGQHATAIADGTADPEQASFAAVHGRWSALRPAGLNTVAFLVLYRSAAALQTEVQSKLDSKSEMGETESLRLQMAMDRLSKMMTTLSNLLKKLSDTEDGIVQNLK